MSSIFTCVASLQTTTTMTTPHTNLIPIIPFSSSIASLCPDVLDQILGLWLDAYDQSIARFVCRQWNQILRYHQHKHDGNDALQVARKKRRTGVPAFSPLPLEDMVRKAACYGHISILQWLHHHHHYIMTHDYNNRTSICAYAAEGGHLEVLQWAHANDCPEE